LDFFRRRWLRPCLKRRSLPLPVILNRLAVTLWVFILGIVKLSYPLASRTVDGGLDLLCVASVPPLHSPLTPTFSAFGLPQGNPFLFAFGDKEAFSLYGAQDALLLHLLAKAL
jgi:hypothetical protein